MAEKQKDEPECGDKNRTAKILTLNIDQSMVKILDIVGNLPNKKVLQIEEILDQLVKNTMLCLEGAVLWDLEKPSRR